MNLKEAIKRIEELERKVRELEARPPQEYHFHYGNPYFVPVYNQQAPCYPWKAPVIYGGQSVVREAGNEVFEITLNSGSHLASYGQEN